MAQAKPRRAGTDDQDVHFDRFGAGSIGAYQAIDGKSGLVTDGKDAGQRGLPEGQEGVCIRRPRI